MDSLRCVSSYARECEFFTNIKNQYDELILHTNHPPNFTKNLGSNLIQVAYFLYNIGTKLVSQVYTN